MSVSCTDDAYELSARKRKVKSDLATYVSHRNEHRKRNQKYN